MQNENTGYSSKNYHQELLVPNKIKGRQFTVNSLLLQPLKRMFVIPMNIQRRCVKNICVLACFVVNSGQNGLRGSDIR